MFLDHEMPAPRAWVEFEGDEKRYPCDWDIFGEAYGLADWRLTVYGGRNPGAFEQVRLTTALGAFVGEAIVASVDALGLGDVRSHLKGCGKLAYTPAAP